MSTWVLLNGRPVVAPDVDPLAAVRLADEAVTEMRRTDPSLAEHDVLRLAVQASTLSTSRLVVMGSLDSARTLAAAVVILEERLADARREHVRQWATGIGRLTDVLGRVCTCRPEEGCEKCIPAGSVR